MGYRILFLTALVFAFASASVVASSPGDTIGTTYYDLQSMNIAGSRICSDTLGGYHFLWMYTPDSSRAPRQTYYNFIDEVGSKAWSAGTQVNVVDGAGFGSITTFYNGNAAIAYHRGDTVWFAKDGSRGAGVFSLLPIPNDYPGLDPGLWPKISRDSSGNFQVFMSVDEASIAIPFVYTYSMDGGSNWATVDIADTVVNITPTATASRVSTKAACVYGRPRDPSTPDYYDCDLYYAQSTNGTTWDFTSAVNVTNYANADTFRVFSDIDAVYDYNDNLHIIWSAVVYDYAGGAGSYDSCALFHWSQATGITEIYRKFEYAYNPLYELNVSKSNIGVDPSNNLFAVWTGTDGSDTSAAGFTNGDLYYSYSTNNGASWSTPTNITDSQSPDCTPGNCDSDNYPSMDELVNQYMHIVYNHDTDPGSVIRGEGDEAICQILYHREDNPLWAGIDDENPPENYRIALTNYPNPFNNNTVFQLSQPVSGELKVYNIRGELVREFTLENTDFARWDGLNANGKYLASGLYFAKLKANGAEMVRRVVMVK